MRLFLILCWLTLPLLAWAYHVGPGQEQLAKDDASRLVQQATFKANQNEFGDAAALYAEAMTELPGENASPGDNKTQAAVQLAMAKSQMESGKLPEARVALQTLVDELENQTETDSELADDARRTLAASQYYMTWLMRLEGLPAEEWEPEVEASRQNYRLLAENSQSKNGQVDPQRSQDLESAIRLARMDLSELQALKIPSQCKGCCSGQCNKPGRKQAKKPSKKKGAGSNLGPLPDGSGS